MVVRQRADAGAEPDVLRALRGGGDEQFRAGDDLVAGRVVLAEPGLVETELVQAVDQLEVTLERERRVLAHWVKGREEDAELEGPVHRSVLSLLDRSVKKQAALSDAPALVGRFENYRLRRAACAGRER